VRLDRVDRDVHLGSNVRGVEHLPDAAQHILFPAAELVDDHRGSRFSRVPLGRNDTRYREPGTEQLTVPAGKFRMADQHSSQPAPLDCEREPALLRLAQLQRLLERSASPDIIVAAEAEQRVGEPCL